LEAKDLRRGSWLLTGRAGNAARYETGSSDVGRFAEAPDLLLPPYMLVVSFGLIRITPAHGPIEIAPGTHRMRREEAVRGVKSGEIEMQSVPLEIGDVLIRHPWALHRGTPNTIGTPRALVTVRYVRCWYADNSREINSIPRGVWQSLTPEQQGPMRFPIGDQFGTNPLYRRSIQIFRSRDQSGFIGQLQTAQIPVIP
jgi:hypothetical protein